MFSKNTSIIGSDLEKKTVQIFKPLKKVSFNFLDNLNNND